MSNNQLGYQLRHENDHLDHRFRRNHTHIILRDKYPELRRHPVEILREATIPSLASRITQNFDQVFRMNTLAWGVHESAFQTNEASNTRYTCPKTENCCGEFCLTKARAGPPRELTVYSRTPCPCLKFTLDTNISNRPLRDILIKKYETREEAVFSLVGYIQRHLSLLPMRVEIDHCEAANDNGIYYAIWYSSVEYTQKLPVTILEHSGNYHLDPSIMAWCGTTRIRCASCRHRNTFVQTDDIKTVSELRGRYYFGLANCDHYLCELCLLPHYAKRRLNQTEDHQPCKVNGFTYACPQCNKTDDNHVIKLRFKTTVKLIAPVPIAWFGTKFVLSKRVFDSLEGFFRRHIAWILPYYSSIDESGFDIASSLNYLESQTDYSADGNRYIDSLARDKEEDAFVIQHIREFLLEKQKYIAFALHWDVPYPEQFLNLDSAYYETVLDRQGFATYIASLNDPTVFPWLFSEGAL